MEGEERELRGRDRRADACGAERLHRQPDAEPGEAARQLGPVVARIVRVVVDRVGEVVGRRRVHRAERGPVADEQRARAVRKEEPLVRIEREHRREARPRLLRRRADRGGARRRHGDSGGSPLGVMVITGVQW